MSDHENQATAEIRDVANMIDALNITDQKGESQRRKSLQEALSSFNKAAATLLERGANILRLLPADYVSNKNDVESIYLAQITTLELGRVGRLLNDSATQAIVRTVISLGDKTIFGIEDLLQHFKKPVEVIAQRLMREAHKEDILWKVAEECYHEATRPSGELNPDEYLVNSKWQEKENKKEYWIKFWISSVCNCPGGPTLFQPPENFALNHFVKRPPEHMPRYLFRVWDDNSKGGNTEDVIASVLSQHDEANRHTIDVFSRDHQEASEMLHHHLDKGLSNTQQTNNLVSWSSSLIFVIQYANWRFCNPWFDQPGEIHICAVDTSKFPRGQFARDKWLLNWFSNAKLSDEETNFRNLRLNRTEYDNGEYLSQGKLHIKGRSCTLSVQGLTNAGLWDLYPAFNVDDAEPTDPVRKEWTKYVKHLRQAWLVTRKTTKAEVQCALNIAEKCFPRFNQDDMALLLLSFCDRKLKRENPSFQNPFSGLLPSEPFDDVDYEEPAEVDRYSTLRKRMSQLSEASGKLGEELFEQLYEIEEIEKD